MWINGAVEHFSTAPIPAIHALDELTLLEMRQLFLELLGVSPAKRSAKDFLRGNIAWAIQAKKLRKKPENLRKALLKASNSIGSPRKPRNKAGTRLIREWRGQTYEVTILKRGYLWQGETYRSLTDIATRITGTKWTGPRFFGLKGGKS